MATGTLTTTGKNVALDALVTQEGPLYLGLLDGTVEESGTGYAREAITFAAAANGEKANSAAIVFDVGVATDWGAAVDTWAIYDAVSSGSKLAEGLLDDVRDMSSGGATLTFAIGAIVLAADDPQ